MSISPRTTSLLETVLEETDFAAGCPKCTELAWDCTCNDLKVDDLKERAHRRNMWILRKKRAEHALLRAAREARRIDAALTTAVRRRLGGGFRPVAEVIDLMSDSEEEVVDLLSEEEEGHPRTPLTQEYDQVLERHEALVKNGKLVEYE